MADVVQDTQQEFWRSPTVLNLLAETALPAVSHPAASNEMADACADCGTEFMIGARFCHTCGLTRPVLLGPASDAAEEPGLWDRSFVWTLTRARSASASL